MHGTWKIMGSDGTVRDSGRAGVLGGNRRARIYGRLDCPAALRALARGGYAATRVFFATEQDARAAGYRPCAVCMPGQYRRWKARSATPSPDAGKKRRLRLRRQPGFRK
jgi:hypothetical protein